MWDQARSESASGKLATAFSGRVSDKVCIDEARLAEGEWMAAFGRQEATHSGEFMGIAATGRRVEIRYMDFWKVVDRRIASREPAFILAQASHSTAFDTISLFPHRRLTVRAIRASKLADL